MPVGMGPPPRSPGAWSTAETGPSTVVRPCASHSAALAYPGELTFPCLTVLFGGHNPNNLLHPSHHRRHASVGNTRQHGGVPRLMATGPLGWRCVRTSRDCSHWTCFSLWSSLKLTKNTPASWPSNSISGYLSKRTGAERLREHLSATSMVLYSHRQKVKQPLQSSIDKWRKKMCCIHTMEYHSALKKGTLAVPQRG